MTQLTPSPEQANCSSQPVFASKGISRRQFVFGASAVLAFTAIPFSKSAVASAIAQPLTELSGKVFDLTIDYKIINITGEPARATVINQLLPGPLLRWKEGDIVTLRVKNNLDRDSSLHWHGMILPTGMDGVPGLSFGGIKPGETFEYQFPVKQSGTYWYHSHSGFQEQTGAYGAIVIDPKEPDPAMFDREYVVMLSDWSNEAPESIYANLKKQSDYYNYHERTLSDLFSDIKKQGLVNTWKARSMWNQQRMSDRDISDVTGATYTYLINGNSPDQPWQALFKAGEKVRLRVINSSAMTIFDVRIPGLKVMVVASDGQNIQPVTVDEFRIGVAETYDLIVEPEADNAYSLFAQSIDRSGYAIGNLTSDYGLSAKVPSMDPMPILTHEDMGMGMKNMGHDHMAMSTGSMQSDTMGHSDMSMGEIGLAGYGSNSEIRHLKSEYGPQVDMRVETPKSGVNDPGIGLREHQEKYHRKVLTYADLKGLHITKDRRQPSREIQLHLTGNMDRYMWSINGIKFADSEPLELAYGERVRITLVNDTMMTHPMHLHGMWSELETGDPDYIPRKHTVMVQPGSKVSYLVTADALGQWAYHCHLLYHMPGMFRKVVVK
ncbi:MAG: copper resistance system multicopper oxidase [Marinomonas sp.]